MVFLVAFQRTPAFAESPTTRYMQSRKYYFADPTPRQAAAPVGPRVGGGGGSTESEDETLGHQPTPRRAADRGLTTRRTLDIRLRMCALRVPRLPLCCFIVLVVLAHAAKPQQQHGRGRLHRRLAMNNSTAGQFSNKADVLFRFALIADSHLWPASAEQQAFSAKSDSQPIRDGLVVARSSETFSAVLSSLQRFASGGGAFAIHAGDPACGGASFHASSREFESQLHAVATAERASLPTGWPIYHVPGNHDLEPNRGGLEPWLSILGGDVTSSGSGASQPPPAHAYRSIRRDGWRIILLDTASAVGTDTDGHGRVGSHQLRWLERQLEESEALGEHVIIVAHQLLVPPVDGSGRRCAWFVPQYDLVENAEEVLQVLHRHSHVRLVLHAHARQLSHDASWRRVRDHILRDRVSDDLARGRGQEV